MCLLRALMLRLKKKIPRWIYYIAQFLFWLKWNIHDSYCFVCCACHLCYLACLLCRQKLTGNPCSSDVTWFVCSLTCEYRAATVRSCRADTELLLCAKLYVGVISLIGLQKSYFSFTKLCKREKLIIPLSFYRWNIHYLLEILQILQQILAQKRLEQKNTFYGNNVEVLFVFLYLIFKMDGVWNVVA